MSKTKEGKQRDEKGCPAGWVNGEQLKQKEDSRVRRIKTEKPKNSQGDLGPVPGNWRVLYTAGPQTHETAGGTRLLKAFHWSRIGNFQKAITGGSESERSGFDHQKISLWISFTTRGLNSIFAFNTKYSTTAD